MEDMKKNVTQLITSLQNMTVSKSNSKGVYVYGKAGTGKTTILRKTYEQIMCHREWVSTPELMLKIRESFRKKSEETESDILAEYSPSKYCNYWGNNTELHLFLDDFGAEKNTEFSDEAIYLLLTRYEQKGKLFITSNFSLQEIAVLMSDRIASRIAGICDVFKIDDYDHRIKNETKFNVTDKNKKLIEYCQKIIDESIETYNIQKKKHDEAHPNIDHGAITYR